eukprot:CAMPEP_0204374828 /NCGR_PEP_ID=MMETSP0469-20131031/48861_1 /ASSEMBLY_ACC=CAM_ASM_000384 /TAXON_ID=2969 /ORGANISM="Oxyrrhis marina" /LENGTH=873 /DNA_ID=CAMNT_0051365441 /DNA_START=1 /DNA_END=2622 /DNA_ORIENTATION=+
MSAQSCHQMDAAAAPAAVAGPRCGSQARDLSPDDFFSGDHLDFMKRRRKPSRPPVPSVAGQTSHTRGVLRRIDAAERENLRARIAQGSGMRPRSEDVSKLQMAVRQAMDKLEKNHLRSQGVAEFKGLIENRLTKESLCVFVKEISSTRQPVSSSKGRGELILLVPTLISRFRDVIEGEILERLLRYLIGALRHVDSHGAVANAFASIWEVLVAAADDFARVFPELWKSLMRPLRHGSGADLHVKGGCAHALFALTEGVLVTYKHFLSQANVMEASDRCGDLTQTVSAFADHIVACAKVNQPFHEQLIAAAAELVYEGGDCMGPHLNFLTDLCSWALLGRSEASRAVDVPEWVGEGQKPVTLTRELARVACICLGHIARSFDTFPEELVEHRTRVVEALSRDNMNLRRLVACNVPLREACDYAEHWWTRLIGIAGASESQKRALDVSRSVKHDFSRSALVGSMQQKLWFPRKKQAPASARRGASPQALRVESEDIAAHDDFPATRECDWEAQCNDVNRLAHAVVDTKAGSLVALPASRDTSVSARVPAARGSAASAVRAFAASVPKLAVEAQPERDDCSDGSDDLPTLRGVPVLSGLSPPNQTVENSPDVSDVEVPPLTVGFDHTMATSSRGARHNRRAARRQRSISRARRPRSACAANNTSNSHNDDDGSVGQAAVVSASAAQSASVQTSPVVTVGADGIGCAAARSALAQKQNSAAEVVAQLELRSEPQHQPRLRAFFCLREGRLDSALHVVFEAGSEALLWEILGYLSPSPAWLAMSSETSRHLAEILAQVVVSQTSPQPVCCACDWLEAFVEAVGSICLPLDRLSELRQALFCASSQADALGIRAARLFRVLQTVHSSKNSATAWGSWDH